MKGMIQIARYDLQGGARLRSKRSSFDVVASRFKLFWLACFVVFALSSSVLAQTTTSTVEGSVKDAQGAVV